MTIGAVHVFTIDQNIFLDPLPYRIQMFLSSQHFAGIRVRMQITSQKTAAAIIANIAAAEVTFIIYRVFRQPTGLHMGRVSALAICGSAVYIRIQRFLQMKQMNSF